MSMKKTLGELASEYAQKEFPVYPEKDDIRNIGKHDVASHAFADGWNAAKRESPWISVNSSKPKDYKELHRLFKGMLIRDDMCTVPVIARAANGDKVIYIMAYMFLNKFTNLWEWVSLNKPIGKIYSITHWMPIPKLEEE